MATFRTALVAVAVGGAALMTGLLVSSASATPAPLTAVSAVDAGTTPAGPPGAGGDAPAGRARSWWHGLTDAQRQCLEAADLRRPVGPLDDAERAALRARVEAAAEGCGVEPPFARARAFWDGLTETQRQCLEDADVTRPLGPLSAEERRTLRSDLRAAAGQCGVTRPGRTPAAAS